MVDNALNFLDLNVYIKQNHTLGFKIFRKPTTTDLIIPNDSVHPKVHKHAAIHAMAHRLHNIPMEKVYFEKELQTIHQICSSNGYPRYIVNNILAKHSSHNKNENKFTSCDTNKKFVKLQFYNDASLKVGNIFRRYGYTPAFSTNNKIINNIVSSKTAALEKLNQSGVYKINCSDCEAKYVGKTERDFISRFNEHLRMNMSMFLNM